MIEDRADAGKRLSAMVKRFTLQDPVVLAIPRGGVTVGNEIAASLGCSMDIVISKKITPPGSPEYAIGAVTADGTLYKTRAWARFKDHPQMSEELAAKRTEVTRRLMLFRGSLRYQLEGRDVILTDDGIATGATVMAILSWLLKVRPRRVVLAIPVMPEAFLQEVWEGVEVACLETPSLFGSVGQFYKRFGQVTEEQVLRILRSYRIPETRSRMADVGDTHPIAKE